jgi:hypothetical protein
MQTGLFPGQPLARVPKIMGYSMTSAPIMGSLLLLVGLMLANF